MVGLLHVIARYSMHYAIHRPLDLTPDSLTVGLSEKTHDFLCAVTGASRADVLIDNTAFEDQSIKDRGIIVTSITIDRAAGIFNSTISIPASIDNNNTDIVCFSVNFSSPGLPPRSEARFFVQGQCVRLLR